MPIELYPSSSYVPPMPSGWVTFRFPEGSGFCGSPCECLCNAVRKLCRQLPPLRAVAGIPRSGLIPASLIAQWQNIPLLDSLITLRIFLQTLVNKGFDWKVLNMLNANFHSLPTLWFLP